MNVLKENSIVCQIQFNSIIVCLKPAYKHENGIKSDEAMYLYRTDFEVMSATWQKDITRDNYAVIFNGGGI